MPCCVEGSGIHRAPPATSKAGCRSACFRSPDGGSLSGSRRLRGVALEHAVCMTGAAVWIQARAIRVVAVGGALRDSDAPRAPCFGRVNVGGVPYGQRLAVRIGPSPFSHADRALSGHFDRSCSLTNELLIDPLGDVSLAVHDAPAQPGRLGTGALVAPEPQGVLR